MGVCGGSGGGVPLRLWDRDACARGDAWAPLLLLPLDRPCPPGDVPSEARSGEEGPAATAESAWHRCRRSTCRSWRSPPRGDDLVDRRGWAREGGWYSSQAGGMFMACNCRHRCCFVELSLNGCFASFRRCRVPGIVLTRSNKVLDKSSKQKMQQYLKLYIKVLKKNNKVNRS